MKGRVEKLFRKVFKILSTASLTLFVLIIVGGVFYVRSLLMNLPDVATLKTYTPIHATEVFSDDGIKIGEFTTERRYSVELEQIPKHVLQAFVSAEDAHFYEHHGVDFTGIIRATITNILKGRFAQGASTITQQVARGILLSSREKKLGRKLREMILAGWIEKELSKDEILNLYLNDIYLGHGAYGIGAAARNYFKKKIEELTLAEAALLAGLPQRPVDWDPFRDPIAAKRRQGYVLKRMVEEKYITLDQAKSAVQEPLRLFQLEDLNKTAAPYFTEYVRQYLRSRYGSEAVLSQGYKVYTTVKYDLQKHAEKTLFRGLKEVDKRMGWRGVTKHLETPAEIERYLEVVHEEVIDRLVPPRILEPSVDAKIEKLKPDLSSYGTTGSNYVGPTPVKVEESYRAVVTGVDNAKRSLISRVGHTSVDIPYEGLSWIQVKTPLKQISDLIRVGDVISVRVEKIDKSRQVAEASLDQEPEIQGALLSYDIDTGFVRAMVGGNDFRKSEFNIALHAKRQVGSTFKPILYAAAIDKGFSPASIVTDSPIVFKFEGQLDADNTGETWRPHNYSGTFEGDIPLRLALIRSMNIPTVKLLNAVGLDYAIQYARRMGITSPLAKDLSIALGSWSSSLEELTKAYAVFPRLGRPVNLVYIKKVVDLNGHVIEQHAGEDPLAAQIQKAVGDTNLSALPDVVISPQTAYVMTDMLKGVVREGTGTAAAVVPAFIAGKTGTSNDHRDAWFVGYTPHVMTGVWLGYEKDKPLDPGETGGKAAAPIFAGYMTKAVTHHPRIDFVIPDEIVFAYIDRDSGRLATTVTSRRVRVAFREGTVPNLMGDNILRIDDPGTSHEVFRKDRETSNQMSSQQTEKTPLPVPEPTATETEDFLRQGYQ